MIHLLNEQRRLLVQGGRPSSEYDPLTVLPVPGDSKLWRFLDVSAFTFRIH